MNNICSKACQISSRTQGLEITTTIVTTAVVIAIVTIVVTVLVCFFLILIKLVRNECATEHSCTHAQGCTTHHAHTAAAALSRALVAITAIALLRVSSSVALLLRIAPVLLLLWVAAVTLLLRVSSIPLLLRVSAVLLLLPIAAAAGVLVLTTAEQLTQKTLSLVAARAATSSIARPGRKLVRIRRMALRRSR